jgi:hypothetical protein
MTETEALQIAREYAQSKGWHWRGPVKVSPQRQFLLLGPIVGWKVETNFGRLGANGWYVVSERNKQVVKAGYVPR